jgi:predicted acetyltransferase
MRPSGTLHVNELMSVTRAAYQRLWQYCCEVDLTTTATASDRSVDEVLPWLLVDARVLRQSMRFDFLWVRILDVCATLSARRYLAEGRVVIEVVDPLGFASGRYALEVGPDGADCRRTSEQAELVLPVDVLGSIFLGGMSLRLVAGDGRVDELRQGSLANADVIFRSDIAPWCATWF